MALADITDEICRRLAGVVPKASWGETALAYNPLAHGGNFCTLKRHDGGNDMASALDHAGVFRVGVLPQPATPYFFGKKPAWPLIRDCVVTGHDFAALNVRMPYPVYARMGWAQIPSPGRDRFGELLPLIGEAHAIAVEKCNKKTAVKTAEGHARPLHVCLGR